MRPIEEFNWGWMGNPTDVYQITPEGDRVPFNQWNREGTIKELFQDRTYEKIFEVEEGDVVVDVGASIGPFVFSILHKNPKHVYALEPSESEFKTLIKNTIGYPVTPVLKGISSVNQIVAHDMLFGGESHMEGITFRKFIDLYDLDQIDFLKIDCEGGEYLVFSEENLDFLQGRVKKISGEWHLGSPDLKEKFRNFRDNILINFPLYEIRSVDGVDIKWDLFNEHFLEYYTEVIVHIDNRKI